MAISGIGSNYNNMYGSTYATQKNEALKKAETKEIAPAQAGKSQNTGEKAVSDYYSYLQKNYDCVKNGSVAISGAYLKECANNPEKAKELEENLSFFKEGYESGLKSAQANARAIGARLVNYSESWSIDSTGNVTMQASATVVTDTKGWKELAEERAEKLKEKKEKAEQEEKIKEKKEEQKPRNTISKLENAVEEGLKNHPPKIIQAEEKEIEISGDIMTEKMKRLEKQLKDGTFKTNSDFDVKA